jgi:hypothetical protein
MKLYVTLEVVTPTDDMKPLAVAIDAARREMGARGFPTRTYAIRPDGGPVKGQISIGGVGS